MVYLGKFRRPVDIALAAALSKAFPIFRSVKISTLISPPVQDKPDLNSALGKVMSWVSAPIDKYGFSFYLSCKITSFVTIAGTATALKYGFDISDLMTYFEVPDVIQDASAAFGVATLTNIVLIPAHFAAVAALSPEVDRYVKEYASKNDFHR